MNIQINIDQLKQDLCRQMAVIDLIERSNTKAKEKATSNFYRVFEGKCKMEAAVNFQNSVTQRLVNYLGKLRGTV